jgi:hypothetical protein
MSQSATPSSAGKAILVTAENFERAETDMYFSVVVKAGGFGKFEHHREPAAIDNQTVVRLNRDTLYSAAVFDLDAGPVTITLPDAGERFMSMMLEDEDQYAPAVVYGAGRYTYAREQIGTRYLMVGIRTLVDPADPKDLAKVHALQDAIKVEQKASGIFETPSWDPASQKTVREALITLSATLPDMNGAFGAKGDVDPVRHLICTASAWGGNPQKDAIYLNVTPALNDGHVVYRLHVKDVPVDGFWSISVYNAEGYYEANSQGAYSLNSVTAKKNADGSVDVQFGGCNGEIPNCLPTMKGWNYMVRLYRPRPEVLSGKWAFPEALAVGPAESSSGTQTLSAAEARAIARDAYVYAFPMVDNYRIMHASFVDTGGPNFKAPWNHIHNEPRVYTPDDTTIQSPNSDTPYSHIGADLRAEPMVLTVPTIEKARYFSAQFIDLYTFNFAYVGSRATGNDGGDYLLAGPRWTGEAPAGIKAVIRCETDLAYILFRTQLFRPDDIDNVKAIQGGYRVQTLSEFLGKPAPPTPPSVDFIRPLTPEEERKSLDVFSQLAFLLQFCPPVPSETELRARFARLGIEAGRSFDPTSFSSDLRQALQDGIADAWVAFGDLKKRADAHEVGSGDVFGTRDYLKNNYLYRMLGAAVGIYGNSKQEAMYPTYFIDSEGRPADASSHGYAIKFDKGQLPPANAFWSLTLYGLPQQSAVWLIG